VAAAWLFDPWSPHHKEMDVMKLHHFAAVAVIVALSAALVAADEKKPLKSGPQVGADLDDCGPFHPMNVNGPNAGKKSCLFCAYGQQPVVMIFAREPNKQLGALLKKIDAACEKHKEADLASFVVFCTKDQEAAEKDAKKCAETCGLKKVVLAIDNPAGPEKYSVNEKADVTVVLYVARTVKANYAFGKGEMKDKDVDAVVKDLSKILPKD
jgi:hypothetical protein